MPPRRPTADKVADRPTIDDLPESVRQNIIQTNFNLEDHIRNIILHGNPYVAPSGDHCPINDLPNELLAHIFMLGTFDDDDDDDDEDDMYQDNADEEKDESADEDDSEDGDEDMEETCPVLSFQVLVSHVCMHWRTVAIETPALWTAITFVDESPPFTRCQTWIERSKNFPIDIEIDCTVHAEPSEEDSVEEFDPTVENSELFFSLDDVTEILDLIVPHVSRWRGLEVQVEDFSYMHHVTSALAVLPCANSLEVLQLYHYGEEDEEEDDYDHFQPVHLREPFFVLFNGNAPKLTHITLWGVHIAWSLEHNKFLRNLKDLELAYHAEDVRPSWEEFRQIMIASPDLDTLSLSLSGPSGQPNEWHTESPIELAGLKNLVLAYHTPAYMSPLIKLLNMPNVTSLALDFESDDFSDFAQQLATPRPGTTRSLLKGLDHLKISGLPCGNGTVDIMYEQLGNLRNINLKLNENFLDETFFKKLGNPIAASSTTAPAAFYCPNLDTLTTSGVDGKAMRLFVETRRKAGVPVKRIFMSEDDDVDISDEVWLRDQLETFELYQPSDEEVEYVDDEMDDEMDVD